MQAIVCKYIGPSNVKGSRIKATADAGSVTIPYPHKLPGQACYRAAAVALAEKLGWSYGELLGGSLPGNAGYVFIFDNKWARD